MPSYWIPGSVAAPSRQGNKNFSKITRSRLNRQQSASLSQNEDTELVAGAMRGTEAIVIRDLRKTFGGIGKKEKVKAVQGVNLDIYPGEITAILGHNGAGTGHVVTFK